MKALVLDKPGTPETLYPSDVEQPKPGAGEVRVKVHAVGLNPVDYKLAASGLPNWDYPVVLGMDIAGVVDAVGKGVEEWEPGDPVYYHGNRNRPGGFGQYAIVTTKALSWLPDGLSYTDAAALPCAGFTAYQAIHRKLQVKAGKTILVQGGAGGVGGFAIQLAKAAGLKVITTCSRHNNNFVKDLGATDIIDYQTEDVVNRVMQLTDGRGVDYIVDTVSSESATKGLEMLAYNGAIACVAGLPDMSDFVPFKKAPSIHEVALGAVYASEDDQALEDLAKIGVEFGSLVAKGTVRSMVEEIVALEEIPDALVRLSMRHVRGKIVAKIPQKDS
jgi:NADPH2:quinone reductase